MCASYLLRPEEPKPCSPGTFRGTPPGCWEGEKGNAGTMPFHSPYATNVNSLPLSFRLHSGYSASGFRRRTGGQILAISQISEKPSREGHMHVTKKLRSGNGSRQAAAPRAAGKTAAAPWVPRWRSSSPAD